MIDFSKIKWSEWMEDTIQHMVEDDVDRAMLVGVLPDGAIATTYSPDITVNDLALAAFYLSDEAHRVANEEAEEESDDAENEED